MIEVKILFIFKSYTAIVYGQRNVPRSSSLLSGTTNWKMVHNLQDNFEGELYFLETITYSNL